MNAWLFYKIGYLVGNLMWFDSRRLRRKSFSAEQAPVDVRGEEVGVQVGLPEGRGRFGSRRPCARAHLAGHDAFPTRSLLCCCDEPLQRLVTEVVVAGVEGKT